MAPREFIKARHAAHTDPQNHQVVTVADRPYLPLLRVDAKEIDSVKDSARQILVNCFQVDENATPGWSKEAAIQNWHCESVSGGITNNLFRVSGWDNPTPDESFPPAVLIRVFGAEGMIDRDFETSTFAALAAANIAPPYYGRFANGRVEGFLEGMRTLGVRELSEPQIALSIAKEFARLHGSFTIPDHWSEDEEKESTAEPTLWVQLYEWWEQAVAATFKTEHDAKRMKELNLECIKAELDWLKSEVVPPTAPITFCHNDLLSANIMVDNATSLIQLIDFEYGGMNYRAFDIANHFNEYAGGPPTSPEPNYEWLPTEEQQREFLKAYLSHESGEVQEEELNAMVHEVQAFIMANHLYWGLWAVNQAATEGCEEFEYAQYAIRRIHQYWHCKKEWAQK